jgi:hypothetical protein
LAAVAVAAQETQAAVTGVEVAEVAEVLLFAFILRHHCQDLSHLP